ncbi:MAG: SDR family oxidoreductase [Bryobacteraceae bacterium]|nr:SDR family oxidoreductase [Bryobacteraceae bacterium]
MLTARETFRRHEILLAGANGFLGKVILGMLLDRFPELRRVHILMRGKRRATPQERFEKEVLRSPPLAPLVEKLGLEHIREKVNLVTGDVGQPDCGVPSQTLDDLTGNLGLVLNCAGLVEFFPPVDESFLSNVDGVENAAGLARRIGAKLAHVSTCFVCGESDGFIEESEPIVGFYPRRKGRHDRGFHHDREIRYMRERIREAYASSHTNGSRKRSRELSQKLSDLGSQRAAQWGWTNTYTYTKSLGEQLLAAQDDLDFTIVRPAIVEAALEFPFPGWVEGGRTAAPLVIMAINGLRHWAVREDAPMEVVPVDQVATAILIVATLLLNGRAEKVYHVSTADANPIYFGELVKVLYKECRRRAQNANGLARLPFGGPQGVRVLTPEEVMERGRRQQKNLTRLQHFAAALRRMAQRTGLPGEQTFRGLAASFRSASLKAAVRDQALELYRPFMYDNRFIFEAENMRSARASLTEEDRRLLPWSPETIDWEDYWVNKELAGVERWIQNEGKG